MKQNVAIKYGYVKLSLLRDRTLFLQLLKASYRSQYTVHCTVHSALCTVLSMYPPAYILRPGVVDSLAGPRNLPHVGIIIIIMCRRFPEKSSLSYLCTQG